jgi:hypothetical protein
MNHARLKRMAARQRRSKENSEIQQQASAWREFADTLPLEVWVGGDSPTRGVDCAIRYVSKLEAELDSALVRLHGEARIKYPLTGLPEDG